MARASAGFAIQLSVALPMPFDSEHKTAYLDNNATSPVAESVLQAMLPWFRDEPGNPSSLHAPGERALVAVSKARRKLAQLLGAASPKEVHFTSGGTESINTALFSALAQGGSEAPKRGLVITSQVEHPATLEFLQALAERDLAIEVLRLDVDSEGNLDIPGLLKLIAARGAELVLVTLLMVNNETGHILGNPEIQAIGEAVHACGALLHLDAVQAAGKIRMTLGELPVDMASISGHKFHGPKGTGALYVRRGVPFTPLLFGGPQENTRRAGTENVPGVVGLGAAAELAKEFVDSESRRASVRTRRDRLEQALEATIPGARIASTGAARVDTATCIEFPGIDGEAALIMLSHMDVAVSTGSACGSTHHAPSHVLLAMGRSDEEASSSLRFSLSRETTDAEIDLAIHAVPVVVQALQSLAPGTP
jgi:cysteine desulfurase